MCVLLKTMWPAQVLMYQLCSQLHWRRTLSRGAHQVALLVRMLAFLKINEHRQRFVRSLDARASPLLPPHIVDWIVEADGPLECSCLWVYFIISSIFSFQKQKSMAKLTFISSTTTSAATDTAAATSLPLTPFEWFNEEGCRVGKAKELVCLVDLHLLRQKTSCASPWCITRNWHSHS
jgi:hypothetical protein